MKISIKLSVYYIGEIEGEDKRKVEAYAKQHNLKIEDAIIRLAEDNEIDIYSCSQEVESDTEEILLLED